MNQDELIQLLSAHEWNDVEFKEAQQTVPKNAYETVSAFANTAGGHLVFGVRKDGARFEVVGVLDVDKVQNEFVSTLRQKEKISLIINFEEHLRNVEGNDLLVFYVPEATRTDKPVYLNGDIRRAFIRKVVPMFAATRRKFSGSLTMHQQTGMTDIQSSSTSSHVLIPHQFPGIAMFTSGSLGIALTRIRTILSSFLN
jgi:predicted HTH transcriptional regulator